MKKTAKKFKPTLTLADINWLIDSMKLVFPTKEESTKKFDKVMEKLDYFVGEIKVRREEQTLHQGQHEEIAEHMQKVQKKLNISSSLS